VIRIKIFHSFVKMNVFRKVKRSESGNNDWKLSGSFVKKPVHGWIHPDHQLQSIGVTYQMRYVGAVKILESMRTVPFERRGDVVREAIMKCCFASMLFNFKHKKTSYTHGVIGDVIMDYSGEQTTTTFSTTSIKSYILSNGKNIAEHVIENISFASIGEGEYKSLIGYISKDADLERACFIFECENNLSDDIILTIGQAFELKYKQYLQANPVIQPVITRFTDPIFDTRTSSNSYAPNNNLPFGDDSNNEPSNNQPFGEMTSDGIDIDKYSHLLAPNLKKGRSASSTSYDTLSHNSSNLITRTQPMAPINFAPGASYESDFNFATVYDNPIAHVDVKKQQQQQYEHQQHLQYEQQLKQQYEQLHQQKLQLEKSDSTDVFYDNPHNIKEPLPPIPFQDDEDKYLQPERSKTGTTESGKTLNNNNPPPLPERNGSEHIYRMTSCTSLSRDIENQVWFHGGISRQIAETFLKNDGDFLVREQISKKGQYVLSGMKDQIHRHLLLVDPHGVIRTRDNTFDSVLELVNYHVTNNEPIYSGGSGIMLVNEISINKGSVAV